MKYPLQHGKASVIAREFEMSLRTIDSWKKSKPILVECLDEGYRLYLYLSDAEQGALKNCCDLHSFHDSIGLPLTYFVDYTKLSQSTLYRWIEDKHRKQYLCLALGVCALSIKEHIVHQQMNLEPVGTDDLTFSLVNTGLNLDGLSNESTATIKEAAETAYVELLSHKNVSILDVVHVIHHRPSLFPLLVEWLTHKSVCSE